MKNKQTETTQPTEAPIQPEMSPEERLLRLKAYGFEVADVIKANENLLTQIRTEIAKLVQEMNPTEETN